MIRFTTCHDITDPALHPRRAAPDWFDSLGTEYAGFRTVKHCPAFVSLFQTAIVVPLWSTFQFERVRAGTDEPDPLGTWVRSQGDFPIENHSAKQLGLGYETWGMDSLPKLISPWTIELDPGWSVMVTPASLHDPDIFLEPFPGILNADAQHQLHLPCRWTRTPAHLFEMWAGTPIAYLLPFRRDDAGEIVVDIVDEEEYCRVYRKGEGIPRRRLLP